jgi:hypothetical protein
MVKTIVFSACAALALLAFGHRIYLLRKGTRSTSQNALAALFGTLAGLFAVSVPDVSATLDRLTGLNNLAAFLIQFAILLYCGESQALVASWTLPRELIARKTRTYWVLVGIAVPVMGALFLTAGVHTRDKDFLMQNAGRPTIAIYIICYSVILTVTLGSIVRICWKYHRDAKNKWLRRGLLMIGFGTMLSIGYPLTRVADVIGQRVGANPASWEFLVPFFAGLGTLIGVPGLVLPSLGPRLSALGAAIRAYRDYRRLRPLWSALRQGFPDAVPGPVQSSGAGPFTFGKPNFLLYQRVVAIRDGLLAVRPWMEPDRTADLRATLARDGLAGARLDATVAATQLDAALRARRAGAPARTDDAETASGVGVRDDELVSETEWLLQVAQAFQVAGPVTARDSVRR